MPGGLRSTFNNGEGEIEGVDCPFYRFPEGYAVPDVDVNAPLSVKIVDESPSERIQREPVVLEIHGRSPFGIDVVFRHIEEKIDEMVLFYSLHSFAVVLQ